MGEIISSPAKDILYNLVDRVTFALLSLLKLKKGDIKGYKEYSSVVESPLTKDELLKKINCLYSGTYVWGEIEPYVDELKPLFEKIRQFNPNTPEEEINNMIKNLLKYRKR